MSILPHTGHLFLKSSWRYIPSSWPHCSALQRCPRTAPSPSVASHCVVLQQPGPRPTRRSLPGPPGTSAAAVRGSFSTERPLSAAPHFCVRDWWKTQGWREKAKSDRISGFVILGQASDEQEWDEPSAVFWLVDLYHEHWFFDFSSFHFFGPWHSRKIIYPSPSRSG